MNLDWTVSPVRAFLVIIAPLGTVGPVLDPRKSVNIVTIIVNSILNTALAVDSCGKDNHENNQNFHLKTKK